MRRATSTFGRRVTLVSGKDFPDSLDGREAESQKPVSALRTLWMALSCLGIRKMPSTVPPGAKAQTDSQAISDLCI